MHGQLIFCLVAQFYYNGHLVAGFPAPAGANGEEQIICPEPKGLFSHPDSCNFFINCWDGVPTIMNCQEGLEFNEKNGQCDYPQNVQCRRDNKELTNDSVAGHEQAPLTEGSSSPQQEPKNDLKESDQTGEYLKESQLEQETRPENEFVPEPILESESINARQPAEEPEPEQNAESEIAPKQELEEKQKTAHELEAAREHESNVQQEPEHNRKQTRHRNRNRNVSPQQKLKPNQNYKQNWDLRHKWAKNKKSDRE